MDLRQPPVEDVRQESASLPLMIALELIPSYGYAERTGLELNFASLPGCTGPVIFRLSVPILGYAS